MDVSFNIEKGLHYAIVGKNGSGKSTLTKLMLGLYDIDDGEITYKRKEYQIIFKRTALFFFFYCISGFCTLFHFNKRQYRVRR